MLVERAIITPQIERTIQAHEHRATRRSTAIFTNRKKQNRSSNIVRLSDREPQSPT